MRTWPLRQTFQPCGRAGATPSSHDRAARLAATLVNSRRQIIHVHRIRTIRCHSLYQEDGTFSRFVKIALLRASFSLVHRTLPVSAADAMAAIGGSKTHLAARVADVRGLLSTLEVDAMEATRRRRAVTSTVLRYMKEKQTDWPKDEAATRKHLEEQRAGFGGPGAWALGSLTTARPEAMLPSPKEISALAAILGDYRQKAASLPQGTGPAYGTRTGRRSSPHRTKPRARRPVQRAEAPGKRIGLMRTASTHRAAPGHGSLAEKLRARHAEADGGGHSSGPAGHSGDDGGGRRLLLDARDDARPGTLGTALAGLGGRTRSGRRSPSREPSRSPSRCC
jgi:hypothetical protein